MWKPTILCVLGTRPEAIKMAPVVFGIRRAGWADLRVISTGQHRELLDQTLASVGLTADIDLQAMEPGQGLATLAATVMARMRPVLAAAKPDLVLVQGDTSSAFATSLACFYAEVPTGHIEAGLRTRDLAQPFPEELHRQVISRIARWHFAPTRLAREALLQEGISDSRIFVTGNTIIDLLRQVLPEHDDPLSNAETLSRIILLTLHRRENVPHGVVPVFRAVRALAERNLDIRVVFPMHKNTVVREIAARELGEHPRISLCEPLEYRPFVSLLKRCYLVVSDSGGIQEEAAALGKPLLILRNKTERVEAVTAGVSKLCGLDRDEILQSAQSLLDNNEDYRKAARVCDEFGDGRAAERINAVLKSHFFPQRCLVPKR